jgi:hypothetical protein
VAESRFYERAVIAEIVIQLGTTSQGSAGRAAQCRNYLDIWRASAKHSNR